MLKRALPRLNRSIRLYSSTADVSAAETSTKPKLPANSTSTYTPEVAPQSPNYPTTWTTNQRPRPAAGSGPRFEQTDMGLQPNPLSAMELINNEPIRVVKGRKAVCDGGDCSFC
jgi:NADH dehydrogenase (ubiquinone) Fe-S protein 6